jgi:DNA-binding HxlR family transcriptional regulator
MTRTVFFVSRESFMMPSPSQDLETSLKIIAGKWKVLIIWHLVEGGKRYGELRRSVPCKEKVLIRQLRELEADGIVLRKDYQTMPRQVEYSLSEVGKSLLPILGALCEWGHHHKQENDISSSVHGLASIISGE